MKFNSNSEEKTLYFIRRLNAPLEYDVVLSHVHLQPKPQLNFTRTLFTSISLQALLVVLSYLYAFVAAVAAAAKRWKNLKREKKSELKEEEMNK